MNANDGLSGDRVSVPANFWPLFFTSNLIRQIVGETVCFGLIDRERKTQLVVVIPSVGASQMPSIDELRLHFPAYAEGRPYRDPGELPVSIDDLAAVSGFTLVKNETASSTLYVLVPVWEDESTGIESLHYLRFECITSESATALLREFEDEEVIFARFDPLSGEFRAVINVEGKFDLTINDGVCSLRTRRGSCIIPTFSRRKSSRDGEEPLATDHSNVFFLSFAKPAKEREKEA